MVISFKVNCFKVNNVSKSLSVKTETWGDGVRGFDSLSPRQV